MDEEVGEPFNTDGREWGGEGEGCVGGTITSICMGFMGEGGVLEPSRTDSRTFFTL